MCSIPYHSIYLSATWQDDLNKGVVLIQHLQLHQLPPPFKAPSCLSSILSAEEMLWWPLVATQSKKLGDYSIIRELPLAAKTHQQISESYFPPQIWRVIPRWDVQSFIQYSVPMLIFFALGCTTSAVLLNEMLTRIQPIITIFVLFY